jgi:hypothetical protein
MYQWKFSRHGSRRENLDAAVLVVEVVGTNLVR